MSEGKTTFQRILAHDREIIYGLLIVFAVIPYVKPAGLPISVSAETLNFYNTIDKLPEGSRVLFIYDWGSGGWGELAGACIAADNHLINRHMKIIFCSISIEGPLLVNRIVDLTKGGRAALGTYGVDWVHLGYLPGGETALAALVAPPDGFSKSYGGKDYSGTSFVDLPLMKEVQDASDIDLVIFPETGGTDHPVRQIHVPYGIPIISIDIGADWPEAKMFISSGMLAGGLQSLRGSAEYEKLVGTLGIATSSIEALSFNHLLILILIIIGNVEYFYNRKKKTKV